MNAPADILQRMQNQLFQAGLVVEQIEADGEIHRCGVAGKERGGEDTSLERMLIGEIESRFKVDEENL